VGCRRFPGVGPYNFESEITGLVSDGGKSALRLGGEYDVLLTNRLILQPSYEMNIYSQDDESRGRGRGISDTELGLRLRYEVRREFAPYIGVSWTSCTEQRPTWRKRERRKRQSDSFPGGRKNLVLMH
jgi:copper resistance protein B